MPPKQNAKRMEAKICNFHAGSVCGVRFGCSPDRSRERCRVEVAPDRGIFPPTFPAHSDSEGRSNGSAAASVRLSAPPVVGRSRPAPSRSSAKPLAANTKSARHHPDSPARVPLPNAPLPTHAESRPTVCLCTDLCRFRGPNTRRHQYVRPRREDRDGSAAGAFREPHGRSH